MMKSSRQDVEWKHNIAICKNSNWYVDGRLKINITVENIFGEFSIKWKKETQRLKAAESIVS